MPQVIVPHKYHAQQTGWTCGPSTAKVTLSTFGKDADEATLARECGTTVNGTDDISQIISVVNRRAAAAYGATRWPNYATAAQIDALWRYLVDTITVQRRAVMVNIWAGPGTGVPGYPQNQTIMHYITVVGVDTDTRRVYVSDSARFGGIEHWWMGIEKFAVLIPPKAYAALPISQTAPPTVAGLSAESLSQAMGGAVSLDRYRQLLPALAQSMRDCGATDQVSAAMWLAQVGHESDGLYAMEEYASGAAYEGRADLGNTVAGDGVRFKGRGPIQVTGRANYTALSRWAHGRGLVPTADFFVRDPAQLASDRYGFVGVTWYWTQARGNQIRDAARRGDLEAVTRLINGGLNGIDDRRTRYNRALGLGARIIPTTGGLSMADINMIMAKLDSIERRVKYVEDQMGPGFDSWGPDGDLGKNAAGQRLTLRAGVAKLLRGVK